MDRNIAITIPADVWLDNQLSASEKLVAAAIYTICEKNGVCYGTGKFLEQFCCVSVQKCYDAVRMLKLLGYISVDNEYNWQGREIHWKGGVKNV